MPDDPSPGADPEASNDSNSVLNPQFDPTPSVTPAALPGPLTPRRLVAGVHVVSALVLVPLAWLAFDAGEYPQAATLGVLIGLLLVAGRVTGQIAAEQYGGE